MDKEGDVRERDNNRDYVHQLKQQCVVDPMLLARNVQLPGMVCILCGFKPLGCFDGQLGD